MLMILTWFICVGGDGDVVDDVMAMMAILIIAKANVCDFPSL